MQATMAKIELTNVKLEDYAKVVGNEEIENLKRIAKESNAKRVFMVNSTKDGGGVAVLLSSIIPLLNNLGIETHWLDIKGDSEFFEATKSFHNAMQGEDIEDITERIQAYKDFYSNRFWSYNQHLIDMIENLGEGDIIVIHDPQPLLLIEMKKESKSKWIWRSHIDTSKPNEELWGFVSNLAKKYDARIVSKEEFKHGDMDWVVIPPSIDPLAKKNISMDIDEMKDILEKFKISADKPIISQISRLDKWKDPVGVIDVFRKVRAEQDCSLVLVYDGASDDPEGDMMHQMVMENIEGPYSDDIHLVRGDMEDVVNTFQSMASVVLQKSLKEGFALTVSEALWKATPVVASEVGGIPLQVINGNNGYLVKPYNLNEKSDERRNHIEETANSVLNIIKNKEKNKEMGLAAKEHVRNNFLVTRHVKDYLNLFTELNSQ